MMSRPLAGVLLLAALCWPGKTVDVCHPSFVTVHSCLEHVMEDSGPNLTDLANRLLRYPNRSGSDSTHRYQFINIRLEGVTKLKLLPISAKFFSRTGAEGTPGFISSVDMKAEFKWPSIGLAMKAWALLNENGATPDLVSSPMLVFSKASFTKTWQVWLMKEMKEGKATGVHYLEVQNIKPGKLRLEIDGDWASSININNFQEFSAPASTDTKRHVHETVLTYLPSIKTNLMTAMNKWLDDIVLPTLGKKLGV